MTFMASARGIPSFGDKAWLKPVKGATSFVGILGAYTNFGTYLEANANGTFPASVDGLSYSVGDEILVKDGVAAADNGIYTVTSLGSVGSKWRLTRRKDTLPTAKRLVVGASVVTLYGTRNEHRLFTLVDTSGGGFIFLDLYRLQAGTVPLMFSGFTITNKGTAVIANDNVYVVRMGSLVIFRISWNVTANGSGTGTISIDLSAAADVPAPSNNCTLVGDRGGTGIGNLLARFTAGKLISNLHNISTAGAVTASLTGADLSNGAAYVLWGIYTTNDA